jgi:hypothetical protein
MQPCSVDRVSQLRQGTQIDARASNTIATVATWQEDEARTLLQQYNRAYETETLGLKT